ncbi:MAG: hypothetical protein HY790_03940 [Deltaproteobacteria bacterium]|nr:hypothetical protein [Deltaproteobacteria bacterium]MBI4794982.1 hypothetical protein [Deltaproteobacteria bacterium]
MTEKAGKGTESTLVFRPCGRAFFVHYVAIAICFLGPRINPEVGLPVWLGMVLGLILVAAVVYMRWGQEYQVTLQGVSKVWRWTGRRQEIPWENLEEVLVRRGLTQTILRVGNVIIRDKSGGPGLFWFGLADPKAVKAVIEERGR